MDMPIFDKAHPRIIEIAFRICTSMQKISSFCQFILEIQSILESHDQTGHIHFWPCKLKNFLTFSLCEFVSTYKILGYFTDLFRRHGWLKYPAIWWLRTFWHISLEQTFSQKWDLCSNTAHNIGPHYRTNSVKINDFSINLKKTLILAYFCLIFPIFDV